MWKRGGRSLALDRAEALLSGKTTQREAVSIDESDTKRTAPPHIQTPSLNLSDVSWVRSVGEHGHNNPKGSAAEKKWEREGGPDKDPRPETSLGGGSRFLKKTVPPVSTSSQSPALIKNQTEQISEHRYVSSSQRSSQSAALSSLDSTEDNLLRPRGNSSMQRTGKSFRKGIQKASSTTPLAVHPTVSFNRGASHSPAPSSQGGSPHRFTQLSPSASVSSASVASSPSPPPYGSPSPSPSVRGSVSRSRHLPLSLSLVSGHSEVQSLEELFLVAPGSDDTQSERSGASSEDFKMNIMTLDDLGPLDLGVTKEMKKQPKRKETKTSQRKGGGPGKSTADQQQTGDEEELKVEHQEEEEEEEVGEEEGLEDYLSDFESESGTETERSAISERLGGDGEEEEEVSEVREEEMSESGGSRGRREEDYSSCFSSVTRTSGRSKASKSPTRRRDSYSRSHSDWSSSSDTVTSPPHRAVREAAVQTQPDVLAYTWSAGMAAMGPAVGMAYVDPTPVASHTVSAEAVEALSTYSPAVFALNDMLRQQLTMTRHFIHTSSHLHSCLVQSLGPADYSYTTLEDTKEFIRKNKPPTLTVEQALEEVLQEMRDYHYI